VHRTVGAGFRSAWALLDVDPCPPLWTQLSPITVSPLLRNLLAHLQDELADCDRRNAEQVVLDLLHPLLALPSIGLPLPRDERCEQIVATVLDDPANAWELADWAVEVGASVRTLSRIFQTETSMSFSQWRTHARIRSAINDLAAGRSVAHVARAVGYETTSAFVTAFRRCTGRTPSTFFPPGHLVQADDISPMLVGTA
jgi:AraC-like DNA-binding protein